MSNNTDPAEALRQIKARLSKATPEPWAEYITDEGALRVDLGAHQSVYFGDMEDTCGECHANAAFVAHSRTDIEALVEVAERALEEQTLLLSYLEAIHGRLVLGDTTRDTELAQIGPRLGDAISALGRALARLGQRAVEGTL